LRELRAGVFLGDLDADAGVLATDAGVLADDLGVLAADAGDSAALRELCTGVFVGTSASTASASANITSSTIAACAALPELLGVLITDFGVLGFLADAAGVFGFLADDFGVLAADAEFLGDSMTASISAVA
jgi:hypothetical protein